MKTPNLAGGNYVARLLSSLGGCLVGALAYLFLLTGIAALLMPALSYFDRGGGVAGVIALTVGIYPLLRYRAQALARPGKAAYATGILIGFLSVPVCILIVWVVALILAAK